MNKSSVVKIQSAAEFLMWFRCTLPQPIQAMIRPYLDQPYQLALNVLDCCSETPQTIAEITEKVKINPETTRQVLKALQNGGVSLTISSTNCWELLEVKK
ncbi:MAG: hypothetical protein ACOC0N_00930 [Chroococcales cyanobacterium]